VDQSTLLIISDDEDFPRQISTCWPGERIRPLFKTSGSNLRAPVPASDFDLAIVAPLRREALRAALRALEPSLHPVIVVADGEPSLQMARREFPRSLALQCQEGWPDAVRLLAGEVIRRLQAQTRAERAEQISESLKCQATLGQYMIEMRHTVNNALTSVLGNAELLLLEPGTFSAGVRSQIDTIRNMASRMHEILQRFSSLEKELMFAGEHAAKEQKARTAALAQ